MFGLRVVSSKPADYNLSRTVPHTVWGMEDRLPHKQGPIVHEPEVDEIGSLQGGLAGPKVEWVEHPSLVCMNVHKCPGMLDLGLAFHGGGSIVAVRCFFGVFRFCKCQ